MSNIETHSNYKPDSIAKPAHDVVPDKICKVLYTDLKYIQPNTNKEMETVMTRIYP